jgi:hypothetical protein
MTTRTLTSEPAQAATTTTKVPESCKQCKIMEHIFQLEFKLSYMALPESRLVTS